MRGISQNRAEKTGFLKYFKASYDLRNIPGEGTLNPWESACLEVGFPAEDISRVEMDGEQPDPGAELTIRLPGTEGFQSD